MALRECAASTTARAGFGRDVQRNWHLSLVRTYRRRVKWFQSVEPLHVKEPQHLGPHAGDPKSSRRQGELNISSLCEERCIGGLENPPGLSGATTPMTPGRGQLISGRGRCVLEEHFCECFPPWRDALCDRQEMGDSEDSRSASSQRALSELIVESCKLRRHHSDEAFPW